MAATPGVAFLPLGRGNLPQAGLSDCITHLTLVATTAQAVTVPAGSRWAIITSGIDLFVANDGSTTAAVPTSGAASVIAPVPSYSSRAIPVTPGANLSIVSASAGLVSVEFFQ